MPAAPPADDTAELLRMAPGAVYRCVRGSDGRIIWVRQEGALAEQWQLTTAQVAGRLVEELFSSEALRIVLPGLERAFGGKANEFEHASRGRMLRHAVEPVFRSDGRVESVLGVITDITEAQRADEDARIFASAVSHDLRTPLTAARNYNAMILRQRQPGRLDEEGRRQLGKIDDALSRMSSLMEDLLELTEASRMEMDVREVEIGEIAAATAAILREREPARRVRVELDHMAMAWGDERLVRFLIERLITNAWHGTQDAPGALIEFGSTRRGATTTFHLRVLAKGVGQERAARLFRAEDPAADGAGLGSGGLTLATVDCIVRRHGGRLWTELVDGGAQVCFTLAEGWTPLA